MLVCHVTADRLLMLYFNMVFLPILRNVVSPIIMNAMGDDSQDNLA